MKKSVLFFISIATAIPLCSCGGHKVEDGYDATKTNIRVEYFNGGYGKQFLTDAAAKFEEEYKDYKNGDLVGVKIIPVPSRNTGANIASSYASLNSDIVFTEDVNNYYELVKTNKVVEITDIASENISSQGHSILDAMESSVKDSLNLSDDAGDHYYALPWGTSFVGLVYDENFFYNNGLFLSDNYDKNSENPDFNFNNAVIGSIKTKNAAGNYAELVNIDGQDYYRTCEDEYGDTYILCKGPDGRYGTSDDGMPETYDAFFNLCNYIKNKDIYPFISYGKGNGYIDWFLDELFADYEGKEQTELNFTFNGTATDLISVDDSANVTKLPDVVMNPNEKGNNLEIVKSAGRYNALKFYEKMVGGDNWMHPDMISSTDQYTAQADFMDSLRSGTKKSAFLIDGDWWQNEAIQAGTFDNLSAYGDKYKLENRRFKIFSFPKATKEKVGEDRVTMDIGYRRAFILNKIDDSKLDIAKKFLQYCFTDESNKNYTLTTGSTRPFNYTLSDSEMAELSSFGKSVWETTKSNNAVIANPNSKSMYYLNNSAVIKPVRFFSTTIDGMEYENTVEVIKNKKISAERVFNGIYDFFSSRY